MAKERAGNGTVGLEANYPNMVKGTRRESSGATC